MIFQPWNIGFGDHWATLSLLRVQGEMWNQRLRVSTLQHGVSYAKRMQEINDALVPDWAPLLVHEPGVMGLDGFDVWACPPVPTRNTWARMYWSKTVAYQFDGVSTAEDKNPPAEEAEGILSYLGKRGFDCVRLGDHFSVADCVDLCAGAAMFVGSDSGMSHLAHSVGMPVYLYEHRHPVITCHRQKQQVIVRNCGDFISQVRPYLDLLDRLSTGG